MTSARRVQRRLVEMMYRDELDKLARELEPFWASDAATTLCERNVQSLSMMTRDELEAFLEATARGSAKVRLVQPIELDEAVAA